MLIKADVKGLEVVAVAQLSGDKVLRQEILEKEDIHANNQRRFGLPSRLIAKIFKFRLIYGGSAFSYANDTDFRDVSSSQKYWQNVIDEYYLKYEGIARWHSSIIAEAQENRKLTIPSGRYFPFEPKFNWRNELQWPITNIKNYPVQGLGADLVKLARLEANKRLEASGLEALMVSTVHDDIKVDTPSENCYNICKILNDSIEAVPSLCRRVWGYDFSLPLTCEIKVGQNLADMHEYKL